MSYREHSVPAALGACLIAAIVVTGSTLGSSVRAAEACDRTCLDGFTDKYLNALSAHDPGTLPVTPTVKFTENEVVEKLGDGVWKSKFVVGPYRIYGADPITGQTAFLGILRNPDGRATMFGLRLKVVDGKIDEVETIVPLSTSDVFDKNFATSTAKLTTTRPGFSQVLAPADRSPRQAMIAIGNSYYNGIEGGTGEVVAFADDCHRIENGMATVNNPDMANTIVSPTGQKLPVFAAMHCREQFNARVWATDSISNRRIPVVDEARGTVFVFSQYHDHAKGLCIDIPHYGPACKPKGQKPESLAMIEAHHIKDGLIHEQESVWTVLPSNDVKSPWPAQ